MPTSALHIIGEYFPPIHFQLLAVKGATPEQLGILGGAKGIVDFGAVRLKTRDGAVATLAKGLRRLLL